MRGRWGWGLCGRVGLGWVGLGGGGLGMVPEVVWCLGIWDWDREGGRNLFSRQQRIFVEDVPRRANSSGGGAVASEESTPLPVSFPIPYRCSGVCPAAIRDTKMGSQV